MNLPKRKNARLKNYDYATSGKYFITICTRERMKILSTISSISNNCINSLSPIGEIVNNNILKLSNEFRCCNIEYYVIMPNHIHLLIALNNEDPHINKINISQIICALKSLTSNECLKKYGIYKIFQNSFHDHIIRNEEDYKNIMEYIQNNPLKWELDCFYEDNLK